MHPMIKPALRRGWRDRQTVQCGVAPAHAVLLGPLSDAAAAFIEMMDGTRSMERLQQEADRLGLAPRTPARITERLSAAGVLDDATADREAAAHVSDRLRPDLASLSVVHREPGGGVRRLAARRAARVQVRGLGRVGTAVAAALSAAGVGQVDVADGGVVEEWDTAPCGVPPEQVGTRRDVAARGVVRRSRSWPASGRPFRDRPGGGDTAGRPGRLRARPGDHRALHGGGNTALFGGVVEATGVVGPLVLPGSAPCAECLARTRAEREPSWPMLVGQWRTASRRRTGVPACDTALATMVAGAVASYALSYLDGDGACAVGYRLRFALPHLLPDTEQFAAHPECPCGAASVTAPPAPPRTAEGRRQ